MITVRELPHDEYPKLAALTWSPLAGHEIRPGPNCKVLVLEDDGVIVAHWPIFVAVHAEPLCFHPDYRHHPKATLDLLHGLLTLLREDGVQYVFAIIADADAEVNGPLAEKFGFAPIPGRLFGGEVPPAEN